MPKGWLAAYSQLDCEHIDPLAMRTRDSRTPFVFSIDRWQNDPACSTWYELNRDAELRAGLIVPHCAFGNLRAVALCGRKLDLHPHDRRALEFAGFEVLLRLYELGARLSNMIETSLSDRERECLQWIAVGKSDWEIGEILNLSEKTINAYVERAKNKLHAVTRTQAIVAALRFGAITL